MSAGQRGSSFRSLQFGLKVDRAVATVPQTAYGALFNVTGGLVVITGLVGVFVTAGDATVTTAKFTSTPATGTAVDLSTATAITSTELGSMIALPAASGGATVVKVAGGGVQLAAGTGYIVPVGSVGITTSAGNAATVRWVATYVPLDNGAALTAA